MCQAPYRCQKVIRSSILCFNHILSFPHKPIKSHWASVSWVSVTYNHKSPDEDTMMSREEKKLYTSTRKSRLINLGSTAQLPHLRLRGSGSVRLAWDIPSPALNFRSLPIYAIITLG